MLGKKFLRASVEKALITTLRRYIVSVSRSDHPATVTSASSIFRYLPEFSRKSTLSGIPNFNCSTSSGQTLIRCFHGTPELLRGNKNESSQRGSKKGKFVKRIKKTAPPVDTEYVPPRLRKDAKSFSDKTIDIFEGMTIAELAKRASVSTATVVDILVNVGETVESEFDAIGIDVAELVAMEIGIHVKRLYSFEGTEILPRPAVVTVMGHVDHGKTSILDALRQTSVAAKEAGGITQHLGAFVVSLPSGSAITFLDTPGHAAFSAMRARGAAVTDIVVLVVAADDGVMPQTLEAISHANSAKVPIVVAINKCDKPSADPEKVKVQLASQGMLLEETGGDVQVVEVSAVTKIGLDNLEEALLLQAEMMDLKARFDGPAQAYVVEARLDKGRGPLATAIIKAGTLAIGKHVVVGTEWGRIRAIRDMSGKYTERATPALPVEIEGLKGLPRAGDDITVVNSEERARMLSAGRKRKFEKDRLRKIAERRAEALEESNPARVKLTIIIKADVQGTVQAVTDALETLNNNQVLVNVVHAGVGPISQSDVDMAKSCNACIVGFNIQSPPSSVSQVATRAKIMIKIHSVIYRLLEDIGNLVVEKAPGSFKTQIAGEAQVLNIFNIPGNVKIAGCRVTDGRLAKSETFRLMRSGEVVFEGHCASLKREKQDVRTVDKGKECGIRISDYDDFQIGDIIQCMEEVKIKPRFISSESGAVRVEC